MRRDSSIARKGAPRRVPTRRARANLPDGVLAVRVHALRCGDKAKARHAYDFPRNRKHWATTQLVSSRGNAAVNADVAERTTARSPTSARYRLR